MLASWKPDPDSELAAAAANLACAADLHIQDSGCRVDEVDTIELLGVEAYSCVATEEHDDLDFPEWSVLLVLRTQGHILTADDFAATVTPMVGELIRLRLHATHDLSFADGLLGEDEDIFDPEVADRLRRDSLFICAHVDFDHPHVPTREECEARILEVVRPALSAAPAPFS